MAMPTAVFLLLLMMMMMMMMILHIFAFYICICISRHKFITSVVVVAAQVRPCCHSVTLESSENVMAYQ